MMTCLPDLTAGAMVSCHNGMNLSTVVFRDSVKGRSSGLLLAYRLSLPGNLGSSLPPSNSAFTQLITAIHALHADIATGPVLSMSAAVSLLQAGLDSQGMSIASDLLLCIPAAACRFT